MFRKIQVLLIIPVTIIAVIGFFSFKNKWNNKKNKIQQNPLAKLTPPSPFKVDKFSWKPVSYDSTKKYVFLTFDDGPQNGTEAVLELCKKMNVKASFFMVGQHAASTKLKQIVSNVRESYPEILLANHSYTHANNKYIFFYTHPEMAEQDFLQAQQSLNIPYKIARLPGNSAWARKDEIKATDLVKPITHLLDSSGYNVIGWDVEWGFNKKTANPIQRPQTMMNKVDTAFARNHTHQKNCVVILSHDRMFRHPNYTDSLAKFITLLKQNPNYVFETVDHYPDLKTPSLKQ
jgi:peptidoglycan/xylan/chitin deacetylase (PgdA/CDA1 family)